jgi:hypothetical protein
MHFSCTVFLKFFGANLPMFWQELHGRDKLRADVAEGGVDAVGEFAHSGCGAKSDQSYDQCILHQVLTFFAAPQIL